MNDISLFNNDADPAMVVANGQRRILEIKREREKVSTGVVTQAQSALAKLQAKVEAYDAGQRQQTMSLLEGHVAEIMQSLEKRRALEARQARLISKMHASVRVVEEMMDTGIRGRCVDAEEALSALCSER